MDDKCEWKDGKFYPCDNFDPVIYTTFKQVIRCKSCGADIRKPEPEVIIRKSGGTWVLKKDGIDYLMTYQECCDFDKEEIAHMVETHWPKGWKQINDKDGNQVLEITDEIAKLRPMVVNNMEGNMFKLYGVWDEATDNFKYIGYGCSDMTLYQEIRLATVSDLDKNNAGGRNEE